jgi:hypothetical protein
MVCKRAQTFGKFNAGELLISLVFVFVFQDLKQLLKTAVGANSHRIEPRHRGDNFIRVRFRSKDDMVVARDLLHNEMFMGYRLMAVVSGKFIMVTAAVLLTM